MLGREVILIDGERRKTCVGCWVRVFFFELFLRGLVWLEVIVGVIRVAVGGYNLVWFFRILFIFIGLWRWDGVFIFGKNGVVCVGFSIKWEIYLWILI